MESNMKNKGITLVALVITIIILLILAGITISQLTQNGLFENAKLAKERSKEAEELQNATLKEYEEAIAKSTRENANSKVYDISTLSTTYNPYGIPGYILYNEESGILEINLYEKVAAISNEATILNISFIPNLPKLNYETQSSTNVHPGIEFNMLSGVGTALYNGWGVIMLKIRNNYDIEINNINDVPFSGIVTYKGSIKLK